jgi:hypothetical protein
VAHIPAGTLGIDELIANIINAPQNKTPASGRFYFANLQLFHISVQNFCGAESLGPATATVFRRPCELLIAKGAHSMNKADRDLGWTIHRVPTFVNGVSVAIGATLTKPGETAAETFA